MAASARSDRGYHQDYIARIRYSNALPPPPNPPKLLDVPGTGLAGGQYTSAAFASKLAREQPLNIEADGELGMPINLVGLPGVFDGDESAIQGLDNPPPAHPADRPLLRPLSMLGKPNSVNSGVSFLRRTEYISSDQGRSGFQSTTSKDLVRIKSDPKKRKRTDFERDDDPVRMLRGIYKGFDTAYPKDAYKGPDSESNLRGAEVTAEDAAAWENPRHPTKPELTVLDTYPILPDPDAFPDSGNYFVMKFMTNPVAESDVYDSRLDVALLRPLEPSAQVQAQMESQRKAYEADPTQPTPGPPAYEYEFFLPSEPHTIVPIKTAFDVNDPTRDDASLYDTENKDTGRRFFRYQRVRAYETHQQAGNADDQYGDSVALALHDSTATSEGPKQARLQKAAYFYPIVQRTSIRPRRAANVLGVGGAGAKAQEEGKVDYMDVVVREPDEAEVSRRESHKTRFESSVVAPTAAAAA